jgi:hypothetical protein
MAVLDEEPLGILACSSTESLTIPVLPDSHGGDSIFRDLEICRWVRDPSAGPFRKLPQ